MKKITCIDLFSGAGGLSEGFLQTGEYEFLAHVEWELPMVKTLRNNLEKKWDYSEDSALKHVVHFDIQKTDELINGHWTEDTLKNYSKTNHSEFIENGLNGIIKNREVDMIIGGPPCQAYSIAGRAQDPDSMKNDYRNYLFEAFAKVVDYYKPKVFIFENVPGILSAMPGDKYVIERIYDAFQEIGYTIRDPKNIKKSVYNSEEYNVPQARKRVIIIGTRNDSGLDLEDIYSAIDNEKSAEPKKTVKDAIGNLQKFYPLDEPYKDGRKNISHYAEEGILDVLHTPRYSSPRDLSLFKE